MSEWQQVRLLLESAPIDSDRKEKVHKTAQWFIEKSPWLPFAEGNTEN